MRLNEMFSKFASSGLIIGDNVISDVRKYLMDICGPEGYSIAFSNPVVATDSIFVSATITITGDDGKSHYVTALGAQPLKEGNRFIANSIRYVQNDALKNACLLLGLGGDEFVESFGEHKERNRNANNSQRNRGNGYRSNGNRTSDDNRGDNYSVYSVVTKGQVKDFNPKRGAKQVDVLLNGQTLQLIFWPEKIDELGNVFDALVKKCQHGSADFRLKARDNRPKYQQLVFQEFVTEK